MTPAERERDWRLRRIELMIEAIGRNQLGAGVWKRMIESIEELMDEEG